MGDHVKRREILRVAPAVGVAGLAGCTGGNGNGDGNGDTGNGDDTSTDTDTGGGEPTTLLTSIHQQGTSAIAMGQAMGTVVNDNSDSIRLDVRPSQGSRENIGKMTRGEADLAYIGSWAANSLAQGRDPYQDVDLTLEQISTFQIAPWFLVTTSEDIENITDIGEGDAVAAGPIGSPIQQMIERSLQVYGVSGYEWKNITYGDFANALDSGQINLAISNNLNYAVTPPWAETMRSTNTLYVVDHPDNGEPIKNDDLVGAATYEEEDFPEGYENPPEFPFTTFMNTTLLCGTPAVPDGAVSTLMTTLSENRGELAEAYALYEFYEDVSFWPRGFVDSTAVHPEAAAFYEEQGVADDSWEIGP